MTITEPHKPTTDELLDLWHDMITPAEVRLTDPPTSHAARDSISAAAITTLQSRILSLFKMGALADHELQIVYDRNVHYFDWDQASPSSIRTRRKELVDLGYLEQTNVTVLTKSGRSAVRWALA